MKEEIGLIAKEILWHEQNPDRALSKEYQKGFINGMIHLRQLLGEVHAIVNDVDEIEPQGDLDSQCGDNVFVAVSRDGGFVGILGIKRQKQQADTVCQKWIELLESTDVEEWQIGEEAEIPKD